MKNLYLLFGLLLFLTSMAHGSPLQDGFAAFERKEYSQALELWLPLARSGNRDAQFNVGFLYAVGMGVSQDKPEALKWYRMAAEQGHGMAQNNIGYIYANAWGVKQDDGEAVKWYRKAAAQGVALAQNNLGMMYAAGRGVKQDAKLAVSLYKKAAAQGLATAQNNLGIMYGSGQGVTQDEGEAVSWYRKAAEQGLGRAQTNLAVAYFYGRGVAQDDEQAAHWFRLAAEQGVAEAQNDLGSMYSTGVGLKKDDEQALVWFRKAAEQGLDVAQYNLGNAYESGRGVSQDLGTARLWFEKAAAQGNKAAIDRLNLYEKLDALDLTASVLAEDNETTASCPNKVKPDLEVADSDQTELEESWAPWWLRGFSISPAVGLRHLGLDVVRRSDGYNGNIAPSMSKKMYFSLNVETPHWSFGDSPFGFSVFMHAATVSLDEQFVADGGTNPNNTESGQRYDVGTSIDGYYSYILPAVSYRQRFGCSEFRLAAGYGTWVARMSGDIILTPDNQPFEGMPSSPISINTSEKAGLLLMSYRTKNHWLFQMTAGGPSFSDDTYNYKIDEINFAIGKQIVF